MNLFRILDLPVREKGYKSPEEVKKREKEIQSLFKDEKDAKTFQELFEAAKKKGWSKTSVWRYVEKMVNERKIIKEGEGRGATYRFNLVELMQLEHFAYLNKIRELCSQKGLYSFYDMGAVNCTVLGIPSEGLTYYERFLAQAIVDKLSSSWLLLFGLKHNFSRRLSTQKEEIDMFGLLSLFQHEFSKVLSKVLEDQKFSANPKMVNDFFQHLKNCMESWTKMNGVRCGFSAFDGLFELYTHAQATGHSDYSPLEIKDSNELNEEEIVALAVTGNMKESKEFSKRIENWLNYYLPRFFETAREFNFSKAQEIGEVVREIFRTISIRGYNYLPGPSPFVLKKEEKERLLNWNLLLDRYGEEDTRFILDLVEGATSRFASSKNEIDVWKWIRKETKKHLKNKSVINLYKQQKFS